MFSIIILRKFGKNREREPFVLISHTLFNTCIIFYNIYTKIQYRIEICVIQIKIEEGGVFPH